MQRGSTGFTAGPDSLLGKKQKGYQVAGYILFGHLGSNGIHGGPCEGVWAIIVRPTRVTIVESELYLQLGHLQDGSRKSIRAQHRVEHGPVLCIET